MAANEGVKGIEGLVVEARKIEGAEASGVPEGSERPAGCQPCCDLRGRCPHAGSGCAACVACKGLSDGQLFAVCPTAVTHRRFVTVAHVAQDWLVDELGAFVEERETTEVVARPDPGNSWTCDVCGDNALLGRVSHGR